MALQWAAVLSCPQKVLELQISAFYPKPLYLKLWGGAQKLLFQHGLGVILMHAQAWELLAVDSSALVQMLVISLTGCVSLGKSPYLSVPPWPFL